MPSRQPLAVVVEDDADMNRAMESVLNADMRLHAEVTLLALLRLMHVGVAALRGAITAERY